MKVLVRELLWVLGAAAVAFVTTWALCGWQWPEDVGLVFVGPYSAIEPRATAMFAFGAIVLTRAAVLAVLQDRLRRREPARREPVAPLRFTVLGCIVTLAALIVHFVVVIGGGSPASVSWMLPLWPLFEPWLFAHQDPSSGSGLVLLIAVVMLQWPLLGAVIDVGRWAVRGRQNRSGKEGPA